MRHPFASALVALSLVGLPVDAQRAARSGEMPPRVVQRIDSIGRATLSAHPMAGMTIAVSRGASSPVIRRFGMADVALQIPTPDDAVYQIGSVTKQMTAVAALRLVEQGKLSLDADVATLLPSVRLVGPPVTLRQLLDHTSGIASYTEFGEFGGMMPQPLPRDSLVRLIATKPRLFPPGTAMHYNNSGYFLLGLIIERASGVSYETFVQRELFAPAMMSRAHYCSNATIVPRTIPGYDVADGALQHARYLDQRWPYAGGSICASARDLLAWNAALHRGRLLSAASYRTLTTPGKLRSGQPLRYAGGLVVGDSLLGHRALHHGGAIPGFASALAYLPDDSLSIVVLVNTLGSVAPIDVTTAVVGAVLGDRTRPARPYPGDASTWSGTYRGRDRTGGPRSLRVSSDASGSVRVALDGGPALLMSWVDGERFERGSLQLRVERNGREVSGLQVDDGYSSAQFVRPAAVDASAASGVGSLSRYVGRFALRDAAGGPELSLRVFEQGGALAGQIRENTPSRLEPLGGHRFRPAESPEFTVTFEVADDRVTGLMMEAPGARWTGRRVDEVVAPSRGLDATLARMDSLLFDAAFVTCDTAKVFALFTPDIEFYHDQTGAKRGAEVRADFVKLTASCPRAQGVRRVLTPGSLQHFPIRDFGAMQVGEHRFEQPNGAAPVGARFVHLWTDRDGQWKVSRIYSVDHAPAR